MENRLLLIMTFVVLLYSPSCSESTKSQGREESQAGTTSPNACSDKEESVGLSSSLLRSSAVSSLLHNLGDQSSKEKLAELLKSSPDDLADALLDPNTDIKLRVEAVNVLEGIADAESTQMLRYIAENTKEEELKRAAQEAYIRRIYAIIVADPDDYYGSEACYLILKSRGSLEEKLWGIGLLKRFRYQPAVEILIRQLSYLPTREHAIEALIFQGELAVEQLLQAIDKQDKDEVTAKCAIRCVVQMREVAIPILTKTLESSDKQSLRVISASLLGRISIGSYVVLESLIRGVRDTDASVRQSCAETLNGLTGSDLGLDAEAWEKWLAENRERLVRQDTERAETLKLRREREMKAKWWLFERRWEERWGPEEKDKGFPHPPPPPPR